MSTGVKLWLVRHGETEWSLSGQHTSRTDIPLTDRGRQRAEHLGEFLRGTPFEAVLVSPMQRARETCEIVGLAGQAKVDQNLREWDYGIYEGKTTKEIREGEPDWSVWTSQIVGGESLAEVGARADGVIARAQELGGSNGNVALFAHAHILRILAARYIGLGPEGGSKLGLSTGSVSVLGWERETRVIESWNRSFD